MNGSLSSFDTPVELACEIARSLPLRRGDRVLEPHVGSGSWLHALAQVSFERNLGLVVEIMDLDPLAPGYDLAHNPPRGLVGVVATRCKPSLHLVEAGFLVTDPQAPPDWIVGNPPYNVRQAAVTCPRCLGVLVVPARRGSDKLRTCPKCKGAGVWQPPNIQVAERHIRRACELAPNVCFLLKGSFLGSCARREFYADHPLAAFATVRPRPRFTDEGSDNAEYAAFTWDRTWTRGYYEGSFLDWQLEEADTASAEGAE